MAFGIIVSVIFFYVIFFFLLRNGGFSSDPNNIINRLWDYGKEYFDSNERQIFRFIRKGYNPHIPFNSDLWLDRHDLDFSLVTYKSYHEYTKAYVRLLDIAGQIPRNKKKAVEFLKNRSKGKSE